MTLTHKEVQILNLIKSRYTNKQIAEECGKSIFTINHQVTTIIRKLKADDRHHAVIIACRQGII